MSNTALDRFSEASAILHTYHKLDNSSDRSLAEEVHSLKEQYNALQRDYEHMITQFKQLSR